jgi:hypothetical protein
VTIGTHPLRGVSRYVPSRSCPTTRLQWAAKKEPAIRCVGRPGSSRRRQLMRRLCGSRLRGGRGYCRRQAAKGRLHCVLHGGAAGSGHHLTEDRSHSRTLGKARAAIRKRHAAGGRPNAATATRAPNGRFVPKPKVAAPRDKLVARALTAVRRTMSEREHDQREVTLPTVPDKPWRNLHR